MLVMVASIFLCMTTAHKVDVVNICFCTLHMVHCGAEGSPQYDCLITVLYYCTILWRSWYFLASVGWKVVECDTFSL